jgi:hypothetical protein
MSATRARRRLVSPESRRRPDATRLRHTVLPPTDGVQRFASGPPANGTHRVPDTPTTPMAHQTPLPPRLTDQLVRLEHDRRERLRPLWEMNLDERIVAMRRGELTYEQLAAWSARHPEQVPRVNGEFEWIAAKTPDVCE